MLEGSSHQEYILLMYIPNNIFKIQKAKVKKWQRRNRKHTKIMANFNILLSLAARETEKQEGY